LSRGTQPNTRRKSLEGFAALEEIFKEAMSQPRRSDPMRKYVIAALLAAGFVTPALAAQYFVAQNNSTHKCSVVAHKPDGKSLTMLGAEGFKTKSQAESALKGMTECKA
jgi:hypothetical protein